ncbi:MAG: endo alpha-1,4 polygalactosaminidase [Pseudomonadota bacterium]
MPLVVATSGSTTDGKSISTSTVGGASTPVSGGKTSWWTPALSSTWQWQLKGSVNFSYPVTVYDIDLFDTPTTTIQSLHAQGKKVVCYFSAGSSEDWRPDFASFQAAVMGSNLSGWAGERWLDTRSANVRQIMRARLDLAVSKGCDGVEPDNVDGYSNKSGFPLTAATQLDYNKFLAAEAHSRGMAIGLKNDVDQLSDLVAYFDFAVNEQCHEYSECGGYKVFTDNAKPVFNAEYSSSYVSNAASRDTLCATANASKFHTLILPLELDGSFRYSCK